MSNKIKTKKKVSNIMLVIVCTMIILYTVANYLLQYWVGVAVDSTLTTCWYAFWGSELIALTTIKNTKVKYGKDQDVLEDASDIQE